MYYPLSLSLSTLRSSTYVCSAPISPRFLRNNTSEARDNVTARFRALARAPGELLSCSNFVFFFFRSHFLKQQRHRPHPLVAKWVTLGRPRGTVCAYLPDEAPQVVFNFTPANQLCFVTTRTATGSLSQLFNSVPDAL